MTEFNVLYLLVGINVYNVYMLIYLYIEWKWKKIPIKNRKGMDFTLKPKCSLLLFFVYITMKVVKSKGLMDANIS